nr:MAG TPA_asm: hypothetical protein [Caudoviricetes sp.]
MKLAKFRSCRPDSGFPVTYRRGQKTRSFSSGVLDPSVAGVRLPRVNN